MDILECYGHERLWMNSAGDWGHSDPLAVPKCMAVMRERGHDAAMIERVTFDNPRVFLSQSGKFTVAPP